MDEAVLKQSRILIVDDEPANVRLLEKMLKNSGYTNVFSTTSSVEVLSMYAANNPDILLLDINMPAIDGFGVLQRLKDIETGDYLPVLVLTAQIDRNTKIRALEYGAMDFVTKPFDHIEVLNRIRNILQVRLLHKQILNQNQILEQKVRERTRELEETQLEIVRRLGRAAEYRDNETGFHIIRMSKFSQMIGRAAGMSEVDAEMLLNASPMHDIGKIGIPDNILLKPGKFTDEEWRIMKTHSEIGAEILAGHHSELLKMAREIAITHHEKWDGSGYPGGLKGKNIPLVGRIVAIADVFDALTSTRPYKKAWSVEDAVDEINKQSGAHFDPDLVVIFNEVLDEILRFRDRYQEPEIEQAMGNTS
ncbi:MAG: response regulator [Gammaproteobacteria bacterium]|nr:response regulator [Gammaproteobacteria bacterium]